MTPNAPHTMTIGQPGSGKSVAAAIEALAFRGAIVVLDPHTHGIPSPTRLTFWARGAKGGEQVEFFAFGAGRDADTGAPTEPYPDSSPRTSARGTVTTLTADWRPYAIDLAGQDTSYVLGGFAWTAEAARNPATGVGFFLDDIQYELAPAGALAREGEPRFVRSYLTGPFQSLPAPAGGFDLVLRNSAFSYDNAEALLALLADRDPATRADSLRRARLIGDAFVYAAGHDRTYTDGRVRTDYQAGDHALFPGWVANGKLNTAPVAGFYDEAQQRFFEIEQQNVDTGNNAWVMIALLALHTRTGDPSYLAAARRVGDFIRTQRYDTGTYPGFFGGIDNAGTATPAQRPYASTEHNIDVYAAFTQMFQLTGEPVWRDDADHAWRFVEAMWDPAKGLFLAGTTDPSTRNTAPGQLPLDVQAWAGVTGYDFNDDRDGVWPEGTRYEYQPFDIDMLAVESFSCLVLEVWMSEVFRVCRTAVELAKDLPRSDRPPAADNARGRTDKVELARRLLPVLPERTEPGLRDEERMRLNLPADDGLLDPPPASPRPYRHQAPSWSLIQLLDVTDESTEPGHRPIKEVFRQFEQLTPKGTRTEVGSAMRLVNAVFWSPAFLARCNGGFGLGWLLQDRGKLVIERGDEIDATAMRVLMCGIVSLVIAHAKSRPHPPILVVMDECANARLAGPLEEKAAVETRKYGLLWKFLYQRPNFLRAAKLGEELFRIRSRPEYSTTASPPSSDSSPPTPRSLGDSFPAKRVEGSVNTATQWTARQRKWRPRVRDAGVGGRRALWTTTRFRTDLQRPLRWATGKPSSTVQLLSPWGRLLTAGGPRARLNPRHQQGRSSHHAG